MRTAEIDFPDDPKIDEPYRGKRLPVRYEIIVEEWGISSRVYVGESELRGNSADFVINAVRGNLPIENLAENVGSGPKPQWPADAQWY